MIFQSNEMFHTIARDLIMLMRVYMSVYRRMEGE